ncbi:MAG: AsmA-like C-terminal region-containing protein [Bacteroidales bacterium]
MKIFFKIVLICSIIAILLTSLSGLLAFYYRNELAKSIIEHASNKSNVQIKTENVGIIFFSQFKTLSLNFNFVSASEKKAKKPFFECKNLRVDIDLFSYIFRKKVVILKLQINGGSLIIKNQKEESSFFKSKSLVNEVNDIVIKNFRINIQNPKHQNTIILQSIRLKVNSGEDNLLVSISGLAKYGYFEATKKIPNFSTEGKINAKVEVLKNEIIISEGTCIIEGIKASIKGNILGENINLEIKSEKTDCEKWLRFLQNRKWLTAIEYIKGKSSNYFFISKIQKSPIKISANGEFNDISFKVKKLDKITVQKMQYNCVSDNIINLKSYVCNITEFDGNYSTLDLKNTFAKVQDFEIPNFSITSNINASISDLNIKNLPKGELEGKINLNGNFDKEINIASFNFEGSANNLVGIINDQEYHLAGKLKANQTLLVCSLEIKNENLLGVFKGDIENFFELSKEKPEKALNIKGDFSSQFIDFDKLMSLEKGLSSNKKKLKTHLNINVKKLYVFNEEYKNTSMQFVYNENIVHINKLKTSVFEGNIIGDLKFIDNYQKFDIDVLFNNIELNKIHILYQTFDWQKGALQGICGGSLSLSGKTKAKNFDVKSLNGVLDIKIAEGKMIKFTPIQPLSNYLKKNLLDEIHFSALQNTIFIKNGEITIPKMEIQSTALNTYISGKHLIDGDFNYRLTLFLNELILQKKQNIDNTINDDKMKLFLLLNRKNGKVKISHDNEAWVKNMGKKVQREVKEMKSLRQEKTEKFNMDWESETLEPKKQKPQEKKKPKKIQSAVSISWDED